MKFARGVIRWTVLLLGIALGLSLLNGALFRAWIATGPPNENPVGWLFSAWNYLAWSGAAFMAGIGFFLLWRRPRASRSACACVALAAALALVPWIREFFAIDACLDSGGRWSEQEMRCSHQPASS